MIKILIIDDEKDVLRGLEDLLISEHYKTVTAEKGKEGIEKALREKPNLILLDIRLPDMSGLDVCRELKSNALTSGIPVLMVSTRSKDTEKVVGLEVGADDYITKPYSPHELLARIRVALRRMATNEVASEKKYYECAELKVEAESRQVFVDDKPIKLTRKEFDLLVFFLTKPEKAHTRRNLMSAIWGESYETMQDTVDSHIKTLRKKLGKPARFIETLPTIGYRWNLNPEEK